MKKSINFLLILLIIVFTCSCFMSCKNKDTDKIEEEAIFEFVEGSSSQIKFGKFPQTVSDIDVSLIKSGTKDKKTGYYTYQDKEYAILTSNLNDELNSSFWNGKKVENNKEYAFLVEPIVWDILKTSDDSYFLLSNMVLKASVFQTNYGVHDKEYYYKDSDGNLDLDTKDAHGTFANEYSVSLVRLYLQNNFYSVAFNEKQQNIIQTTSLNNHQGNTIYSKLQQDTKDKVFILSLDEATNNTYGFTEENPQRRIKQVTDYALCSGAYAYCYSYNDTMTKNSMWYLRSAGDDALHVMKVDSNGIASSITHISESTYMGIVPALYIKK